MPGATELPVADPAAELSPREAAPGRASLAVRLVTLIAIIVPLLGVVAAPFFLWGWGFHWTDLGLLLGMYVLTALGITVGFHRLFVAPLVRDVPVGEVRAGRSSARWPSRDRYSSGSPCTADTTSTATRPDDPHSPQHEGRGVLGLLRGFWHAHIGWFFDPDPPNLDRYVNDLRQSRTPAGGELPLPALGGPRPA